MRNMRMFKETIEYALNLLFPIHCLHCGTSGALLCPRCIATIPSIPPPICRHCGNPLGRGERCLPCQYLPLRLSGLRVASSYREPLRSTIHALKYEGKRQLGEPLGCLLAQAYQRYGMQSDLIIPVPLHHERLQRRGYNQAQVLATICARQLNIPLVPTLLTRVRTTSTQVQLSAYERRINLQGAFQCQHGSTNTIIRNRRILIIDDVCTTGATLEACAAPLIAAGAKNVWGLVLARPTVTNYTTAT
ncbi:ComF family protein [Dictyobacter arantiisoli]|uniref:Amidophosphoribosyltransferase n=1 Tax=Dictyobacter arantiisoli TaxID=2014874 RepID=A0A5A5TAX9_9CHLR|nr:ComF family protein [Dictyobacter arantiisoli]GCF08582.1 amidophosphoribosyltransferase [Dictyobacter arantiisoli]